MPRRAIAVVTLVGAIATAMSVGSGVASARQSTITLTLAAQATGTVTAFQELASNFERANPDVKINIVSVPVQNYGVTLMAEFRGGQGPDVFYGAPGTGNPHGIINFAKAGYLADLSGLSFVKRLPANAKPILSYQGKLYGLPLDVSTFGAVYNVQLFRQLGLKFPNTWADVLNMCRQVKADGKYMFSVSGLVSGTQILTIAGDFVYGPDPNWDQKRLAGKVTFASSPLWHRALQAWVDMGNAGCFQPGAAGYSLAASQALVGSGQAVAWPGVSNVIGAIQPLNPSMTIGMFPIPGPTSKQTRYIVGYGNVLAVNRNSPNLATAIKFVQFVSQSSQSRVYPSVLGNMSVLQAAAAAKTGKILNSHGNVWSRYTQFGPFIKSGQTIQIPFVAWPNGQVYADLTSGAAGLLAGSTTVDGLLKQLDADWTLSGS